MDTEEKKFFIIVGNQRCGTNYLRDIFMRQTNIYPYGEVFFPDVNISHNFDGHFFLFYKQMIEEDKYNIFFNNPDIFDRIFERYVSEIMNFCPRSISCFDIKSDCFINIPRIYECISNLNIKILHIYRRDKIKRAMSQAVLNKCFDVENSFNPNFQNENDPISLDIDAVYNNILSADGFDSFIFDRYSEQQRLSVCYEDLLTQPDSWEHIRGFLGFEGSINPQGAFTKQQGLGTSSRITNYDEIIKYLSSKGINKA
ncbi:MAG: hypothetical protein SOH81_01555 [Acetobacter sp.]